ncbi:MAG: hypothetical protein B6D38_00855 [Anaerolineae bacterium UTCFX1]|nr:MAG: hypothetical protein B6D38_00855 [Anaerolineae bacterium UTCFX1]
MCQEAIFLDIDLENRVIHRIGIVARLISQMRMMRFFETENCLNYKEAFTRKGFLMLDQVLLNLYCSY